MTNASLFLQICRVYQEQGNRNLACHPALITGVLHSHKDQGLSC